MAGQRQPLRDQPPLAVGERGGKIHVVAQDTRIGGAADRERHLVRDGEDGVPEQIEAERIAAARPRRIGAARSLALPRNRFHAPLPGWLRMIATGPSASRLQPPDRARPGLPPGAGGIRPQARPKALC